MRTTKNKNAVSALVATVLLILITVAAVGIIWGAIMPMLNRATEFSQACINARLSIDTTSGYTCYDKGKKQVSVMIARGAEEFELAGIKVGLSSGGTVKTYDIKPGSNGTSGGGIDSYTKLLLHMDGSDGSATFTDATGKSVTANGNAQIDTAQSKFGEASGLFDGTGDYLTVPDSADWNFVNGDFTIDFWVRFASFADQQFPLSQQGTAPNYGWSIDWRTTNLLYFGFSTDGTDYYWLPFSWTPSINTWYHVAIVRNGNNNLKAFVDGSQIGTTQNLGGASLYDSTYTLEIGIYRTTYYPLNGWLDEVRISKGIARWTSTFTVPTAEYTDISMSNISMPQQNEAKTYVFAAENITEASVAPVVKIGNSEKVCGISGKVQVPKCA